jgi:hypothetical protein
VLRNWTFSTLIQRPNSSKYSCVWNVFPERAWWRVDDVISSWNPCCRLTPGAGCTKDVHVADYATAPEDYNQNFDVSLRREVSSQQRAFSDKRPSPTKGLPRQRAFPDKGPSPTKGLRSKRRSFAYSFQVQFHNPQRFIIVAIPILRTDCLRLHIYIIIKQIIHQFGVLTAHSHGFDNEIMKIVLVKPTLWLFQITTTAGSFNRPALKSSISCVNYQNVWWSLNLNITLVLFDKFLLIISCLWCYSECISTPGELEKYARPRRESNLRPLVRFPSWSTRELRDQVGWSKWYFGTESSSLDTNVI